MNKFKYLFVMLIMLSSIIMPISAEENQTTKFEGSLTAEQIVNQDAEGYEIVQISYDDLLELYQNQYGIGNNSQRAPYFKDHVISAPDGTVVYDTATDKKYIEKMEAEQQLNTIE